MEQIAPLARILAEANGIEWQKLKGTGAGGTVIEEDILNYLSRIMSGEEEPPSTPVDEMPAGWTGDEQLPAGMFSADLLSQAGIDSDIAEFVTQSRAPEKPASVPAHNSTEFELDDDAADLDAPLAAEPAPQPAASNWSWNPDSAGNQAAAGQAANQAAPVNVSPSMNAPAAEDVAAAPAAEVIPVAAPPVAPPTSGLGSLLARLYNKAVPEAPRVEHAAPQATPVMETAPEVQSHSPQLAAPEVAVPEVALPEVALPEVALPEVALPEVALSEIAVPEIALPETAVPEVIAPEVVTPQPDAAAPEYVGAAQASPVETSRPDAAVPQATVPEIAMPEVAAPEPVAASAAPRAAALPAAAVWFGSYLRRDIPVMAAHDLGAQLSEALGQDVSLAFLVARAAQRHAGLLGLEHVALLGTDGQEQPITGAGLREAVQASVGQSGAPDVLVTDAGALDMDDLHYPHTLTLSLGRVQEGRAALSLNGNVEPRQGAQFLARVAEALEKPIALVL